MAHSYKTLAELVTLNDRNLVDAGISDLFDDAPLFGRLAAITASHQTSHKYLKQTGAPTVGFRAVNVGTENSKSADTQVTVDLKILAASFALDKAWADNYGKGGAPAALQREARRHLKAAMQAAELQFINGTGSNADGFSGLRQALATLNTNAFSAGGDTANACSSVYFLRTSEDEVAVATGDDGKITIGESTVIRMTDADGKAYPAYYTPIEGWIGLIVGAATSCYRLCNVDFDHTLTDDLCYSVMKRFPAGRQPNLIAMNRTSLEQLRSSRTATNTTGAPAPRPTDIEGIPILVTDGILDTEPVVS
jgi:hypothetical protein